MQFITWLGLILILSICLAGDSAHAARKSSKTNAKVVPRLAPADVLKRAAKVWEDIQDFQGILHQTENHPDGHTVERWARVTLIKTRSSDPDNPPIFLVNFYDHPVALESVPSGSIQDGTPLVTYFSDDSQRLMTYKPDENTLDIERLEDTGPLPEFLYIAGFVDFDLDKFYERAYLDDEVWSETIDGQETYRIKAIPRKKHQDIEPARYIWIKQDDNFIKRFAVEGDVSVRIDFTESKLNQHLTSGDLIPIVPADAYVNDHTR